MMLTAFRVYFLLHILALERKREMKMKMNADLVFRRWCARAPKIVSSVSIPPFLYTFISLPSHTHTHTHACVSFQYIGATTLLLRLFLPSSSLYCLRWNKVEQEEQEEESERSTHCIILCTLYCILSYLPVCLSVCLTDCVFILNFELPSSPSQGPGFVPVVQPIVQLSGLRPPLDSIVGSLDLAIGRGKGEYS